VPRAKPPRRSPPQGSLKTQIQRCREDLASKISASEWSRICKLLGRDRNYPFTGNGATLKQCVLHVLATCKTQLKCGLGLTPAQSKAWIRRVRKKLRPLAEGERPRPREIRKLLEMLDSLIRHTAGLDESTDNELGPAARRLRDALLDRIPAMDLAKALDDAAAHIQSLWTAWSSGANLPDGTRARRVEARKELVMQASGRLREIWERFAAPGVVRSIEKRRIFVGALLYLAEVPYPVGNSSQDKAFDKWIETDVSLYTPLAELDPTMIGQILPP
jgi:hypothetical protein